MKLFFLISLVYGKKNTKPKRPAHIEPMLYCEACKGVVWLSTVSLKDSRSDYDMYAVFAKICDVENFPETLNFPPPYMAEACLEFMELWEPKLETLLVNRKIDTN